MTEQSTTPDHVPTAAPSCNSWLDIERNLASLRERATNHPVYARLDNLRAVQVFMEYHCYPVTDFMCLLKSLQARLTVTTVPWFPPANAEAARFINEIVVAEESDEARGGGYTSHYTMYIDAMKAAGADTTSVESFVEFVRNRQHYRRALRHAKVPQPAQRFVKATMEMCLVGKNHEIASCFVFGRECLIPDMFLEMLTALRDASEPGLDPLVYYVERHIEIDSGDHGPAARRMLEYLCGDDAQRWRQAEAAARQALTERIRLWDAIEKAILRD
jgi:hypothetical protein